MFTVKNLSPNPLPMPDGTMLAAGSSRDFEEIDKPTKDFAKREWLSIDEQKEEIPADAAKQPIGANTTGGLKK